MLFRSFLLLLCSGLFLTLNSCRQKPTPPEIIRPKPLPQDTFIQAYFNHNEAQGATYTDPYREQARSGDNLEQIIINTIASANQSIEVAVQEFRLPKIAQALAEKHQTGVQVRVILENNYRRPFSSYSQAEINQLSKRDRSDYQAGFNFVDINQDGRLSEEEINQRDALVILEKAGVPILDDTADGTKGSGLMHHKFIIVDQEKVIVSSANFTLSGIHGDLDNSRTQGNANNLVVLASRDLAQIFLDEFNLMWGDGVGNNPDSVFGLQKRNRQFPPVLLGDSIIKIHFSPLSPTEPWEDSSNGFISSQLEEAARSVNLALFVFSDQKIADTLANSHQQGIQIRGLIDSSFAYRYYSEGLDLLGVALARNCKFEDNNNPWDAPVSTVGIAQLPEGDKLHHKFAVIDEESSQ